MFYLVCVILLKYSFEEIFVYGWLLVRVPTPEKLLNKSSRSCSNHVQFTAVVHLHYSLSTLSISDTLCRLIVSDCFLQVLILFKLLLKVNRNGWDYIYYCFSYYFNAVLCNIFDTVTEEINLEAEGRTSELKGND